MNKEYFLFQGEKDLSPTALVTNGLYSFATDSESKRENEKKENRINPRGSKQWELLVTSDRSSANNEILSVIKSHKIMLR